MEFRIPGADGGEFSEDGNQHPELRSKIRDLVTRMVKQYVADEEAQSRTCSQPGVSRGFSFTKEESSRRHSHTVVVSEKLQRELEELAGSVSDDLSGCEGCLDAICDEVDMVLDELGEQVPEDVVLLLMERFDYVPAEFIEGSVH